MADDDTKSVSSKTSKSSKYSVTSFMSKASNASSYMKNMVFRPNHRSTTHSVAALVDLRPGDQCETVSLVTIRADENLDSALVAEVPPGQTLEVVEVGVGRRIRIKTSTGTEGWISSKTKLNEPLVMKRQNDVEASLEGWEIGGQHEIKSMVTVRTGESLDSDIIGELKPGTIFNIKELGTSNNRRALIDCGAVMGWISLVTKNGELLAGKVSSKDKVKPAGLFGTSSSKVKEMLEAARSGDLEGLQRVLEPGTGIMSKFSNRPNLNASDIRGKTALIYASSFGNQYVVEYLLSKAKEIEVNAVDDTDKTALHHAARRASLQAADESKQADIISGLVHAKAYIEARDHNGCTALMFAVANGNEGITRRLVLAQANVNTADYENHSCLSYAKQFGQTKICQLLKKAGARENISLDDDGDEDEEDAGAGTRTSMKSTLTVATRSADEETQSVVSGTTASTAPTEASAAVAGGEEAAPKKKKVVKKKVKAEGEAGAEGDAAPEGEEKEVKKKKKKEGKEDAEGKKEKKKKKTVNQERRGSGLGMMEAIAIENSAAAVLVQADATEDVDLKALALQKLSAVAANTSSPKELEECIKAARTQGAEDGDVAEAEQTLKTLKAKGKARDDLQLAVKERDVAKLEAALQVAMDLTLADNEIADARKVLDVEKPKQIARDKLKSAQAAANADELKSAVAEAKQVGVAASELEEYEELLAGAESKEKAEAALKSAVEERNVASLKFAIQQAKDAGVASAAIAEADDVLKIEEPKARAREQIENALNEISIPVLKEALEAAKKAGLEPKDYAEAEAALAQEEKKEQLLAAAKAALEESKSVDMKSIEALREMKEKLNVCVKEGLAVGVPEAALFETDARRKKLHNAIEDLKGSIRVFCRVRPLSSKETNQGDTSITEQVDQMTIKVRDEKFGFDAVFLPGTQDEVFEDCRDLVQSAVDGYNVTMFAYGQTGAGKTFTMYGCPGNEGTCPKTINEIFRVIEEGQDRFNFTVMASMLELYCNDLVDLLAKDTIAKGAKAPKLNVRHENSGQIRVEHLTEEPCTTAEELSALLERGNAHRSVASTAMNAESSRSHLVLMIKIISVNKETKEQLRGKLLLCDLAGSERLKKSEVSEKGQKEAIEINKSLTALGDVIEALTKGGKNVIPYRNHKLTQLMQDSLGGTSKTLMFVNCSPASSNLDETFMSLKYAQRAKKITNKR